MVYYGNDNRFLKSHLEADDCIPSRNNEKMYLGNLSQTLEIYAQGFGFFVAA